MAARDTDSLWVLIPTGQQSSGAWIDDTLKERVQEKGNWESLLQLAGEA